MSDPLDDLMTQVRSFRDTRDWKKFHTIRNLIVSVSIEAGEMLELTQWKSEEELANLASDTQEREALEQEAADIFIYLLLIADGAGFNLLDAAHRKLALNEDRYPAEKSRGKATKYTDL